MLPDSMKAATIAGAGVIAILFIFGLWMARTGVLP